MNKILRIQVLVYISFIVCMWTGFVQASTEAFISKEVVDVSETEIDSLVERNMKEGEIPGMAIAIIKDDKTVYQKCFGFSNLKAKIPVTSNSLFELGSTSKAFTALGIFLLEHKGLIDLEASVRRYLPWLKLKYNREYTDITLNQLLHHTSGIPFQSISDIPAENNDNSLENTVEILTEKSLDFRPGEKFLYATINYDVLGLIIEKTTGIPFEKYMKENVIITLGLYNTYLGRDEAILSNMAVGYKMNFLRPKAFEAPVYRGNTPAGYYITNIEDAARWLKIQLGTDGRSSLESFIEKSHVPDITVPPASDGSFYASGWYVNRRNGEEFFHSGSNPNFSSFFIFRPEEKLAVAVLANMNSTSTANIGHGVLNLLQGEISEDDKSDLYKNIDMASTLIFCVSIIIMVINLYFFYGLLVQFFRRKRVCMKNFYKIIAYISLYILFIAGFALCIYYTIPIILFKKLSWNFINVWVPQSFIFMVYSLLSCVALLVLYISSKKIYQETKHE